MNATPTPEDSNRHPRPCFTVYGRGATREHKTEHRDRVLADFLRIYEGFVDVEVDGKPYKPTKVKGKQIQPL